MRQILFLFTILILAIGIGRYHSNIVIKNHQPLNKDEFARVIQENQHDACFLQAIQSQHRDLKDPIAPMDVERIQRDCKKASTLQEQEAAFQKIAAG